MRLRGRKFVRNAMERRVENRIETADGILWSIDTTTNTARVRIQGSGTDVVAHYPRNWKQQPYWLKVGNAVRVTFRSGRKGYIEITGEGRAIPTPESGAATPTPSGAADMVLTGMDIRATNPASKQITISNGTYRINGVVYVYTPPGGTVPIMVDDVDPPPMTMDSAVRMDDSTGYFDFTSIMPPAGQFRYVAMCVGIDGITDTVAGTISTAPVKPAIPAGHVLIDDYILLQGGQNVEDYSIGGEWAVAVPSQLELVYTLHMPYATASEIVTVKVKDQWGNYLSGTYTITATIMAGSGTVTPSSRYFVGYQTTFTYSRNTGLGEDEHSPLIQIEVGGKPGLQSVFWIELLDSEGNNQW